MMRYRTIGNVFLLFLLTVCAVYFFYALKMPFGKPSNPGAGFLPAILGASGVILCLALLLSGFFRKDGEDQGDKKKGELHEEGGEESETAERHLFKLLAFMLAILLFVVLFELFGAVTLFPLLFCLAKLSGFRGWLSPLLFSGIAAAVLYVTFKFILAVPLPAGTVF